MLLSEDLDIICLDDVFYVKDLWAINVPSQYEFINDLMQLPYCDLKILESQIYEMHKHYFPLLSDINVEIVPDNDNLKIYISSYELELMSFTLYKKSIEQREFSDLIKLYEKKSHSA